MVPRSTHDRRRQRHPGASRTPEASPAVLALGQVVGGAALASAVTLGAFVVQDILGHDTPWAGTAMAVTTTGTAFMSQVLARKMSRHGRRPGLRLGYGLAAVGGGIAAVGVETGSLSVFEFTGDNNDLQRPIPPALPRYRAVRPVVRAPR